MKIKSTGKIVELFRRQKIRFTSWIDPPRYVPMDLFSNVKPDSTWKFPAGDPGFWAFQQLKNWPQMTRAIALRVTLEYHYGGGLEQADAKQWSGQKWLWHRYRKLAHLPLGKPAGNWMTLEAWYYPRREIPKRVWYRHHPISPTTRKIWRELGIA